MNQGLVITLYSNNVVLASTLFSNNTVNQIPLRNAIKENREGSNGQFANILVMLDCYKNPIRFLSSCFWDETDFHCHLRLCVLLSPSLSGPRPIQFYTTKSTSSLDM